MTIDLDKLEQLKAAVCDDESATEWINALNNAVPALIAELREARATIERQARDAQTDREMYDDAMEILHNCGQRRREADRAIACVRRLAVRWRDSGNASYIGYGEEVLAALDGARD